MDKPFQPEPIMTGFEDDGLRWDARLQCVVWEETLRYDPDSEWCRALDDRIRKDDKDFLAACGIADD